MQNISRQKTELQAYCLMLKALLYFTFKLHLKFTNNKNYT
jgi:hypothetical protein